MRNDSVTLGLIVGNRGFFPDHLAQSGRQEMMAVLEKAGVKVVALTPADSKHGAVETREESHKCADLFRRHRDEIDGVVVTLPNFGEERGIADALRFADLDVPVLIQATPDHGRVDVDPRPPRQLLRQDVGLQQPEAVRHQYSLTSLHTEAPESAAFAKDLEWFKGVCRVVRGLRRLRIGAVGARPAAFNTVRFSEKLLERAGISVEPIDLSEILGRINRLGNDDPGREGQAGRDRRLRPDRWHPHARPRSRWPSSGR